MKKWIRWKGLIGFTLAVVVLALFYILFIDSIIRNSIEYAGTRMVGAKVELAEVDFKFSPMGMKLGRLQVTNPDVPMQNIIDIKQIRFNMDSLNILRRKVLINEMRVEGVQFHTARKTSGAIKKAASPKPKPRPATDGKKKETGLAMPDIKIPNVDEIMGREEIKTIGMAEKFKTDSQVSQDRWKKIVHDMPDEKRVDEHKARLDKIKQTNTKDIKALADAIEDLKRLKKDIKSDMSYVDNSRNKISGDLGQLNKDFKALKSSPEDEYRRLTSKYSVTAGSVGNISQLLFGGEAKKYTNMAMGWYKKIEPYMAYVDFSGGKEPQVDRHKGLDIRFKEYNPQPDFLIKVAHASFETDKGRFSGKIMDITGEQDITRKPVSLRFSGNKMKGIGSILLTGSFNHIDPSSKKDQINFTLSQYALNKYRLIDREDMTIYLDKAKSDLKLVASRVNDNIQADFRSHVHSIQYNNTASGNEMAMMFLSSINKTRDFNIYGKLRGTFDNYSTKVSSDLDNRLRANMGEHINRRLAGFRKQLRDKIQQKARQPIDEAEKKLKDLNSMVKNDIAIRKARLTHQYNSVVDEEKRKQKEKKARLKNKAEDKLKNLFNKYK
ncbi:MAG: TIGR03545 family protein [Gammaproteobacteria bacterium]|nr:TIGR03545 family protein [Gammaproteobacteria bacterium]